MDERVKRLDTPKKCEIFARNARKRAREDLALEANQRAVQLRAEAFGASSQVEKEALQAVYAYEEVLTKKNGRRTRASRTWPMIERHGIIEAVERAVNRPTETQGYKALAEMGLQDYAFEAVILRYPDSFSESAIEIAQERLARWRKDDQ
jgi:hypothetical protein